ncbi:MAG: hypothetical protein ACTSPQ_11945 [Candidatus Helarchaeota archaeon]
MVDQNLLNENILLELVPKLYNALKSGKTNIEITKNVSININFGRKQPSKKKKTLDERLDDLW